MIEAFLMMAAVQAVELSLPPSRAEARASLASYVSRDDYPVSASARGEEGEVAFQLTTGADGRVTHCTILATNASSTLANTTCRLMRSRARFTPARDADGQLVADAGMAVLRWSLAEGVQVIQEYLPATLLNVPPRLAAEPGGPPIEPARARANLASYVSNDDYPSSSLKAGEQGTVRFRLAVGDDGRVTNCQVTGSSGSSTLDSTTCRLMRSRARFTPARDRDGNPTADTVSSSITWRMAQTAPPAPAETP
jgi:TonB family protein